MCFGDLSVAFDFGGPYTSRCIRFIDGRFHNNKFYLKFLFSFVNVFTIYKRINKI